jgi:hypothetical protein
MYNSVNHLVINTQKLKEIDEKEKRKKKRYEIRYETEKYYQDKNIQVEKEKDSNIYKKVSYNRFESNDKRGYDIINLKQNYDHYKNISKLHDDKSDWEKILEKAGEKETFSKKGIYRDPYDYSDCGKNASLFMKERDSNFYLKRIYPIVT